MEWPTMSRQDVTGHWRRVAGAEHDRLAAAMYAMDTHPAHALLAGRATRGATARAWSDAQDADVRPVDRVQRVRDRGGDGRRRAVAPLPSRHRRSARADPPAHRRGDPADPGGGLVGSDHAAGGGVPAAQGCEAVTEVFDTGRLRARAGSPHSARSPPTSPRLERLVSVLGDPPELRAMAGPWVINADPECAAALRATPTSCSRCASGSPPSSAAAAADPLGALDSRAATGGRRRPAPARRRGGRSAGPGSPRPVRVKTGLADRLATIAHAVARGRRGRGRVRRSLRGGRRADRRSRPAAGPATPRPTGGRLAEVRRSVPPPHEPLGSGRLERLDTALARWNAASTRPAAAPPTCAPPPTACWTGGPNCAAGSTRTGSRAPGSGSPSTRT
jgi:hypothetical protein